MIGETAPLGESAIAAGYDSFGNICVTNATGISAASNLPGCMTGANGTYVPVTASTSGTYYNANNQLTATGVAPCGQRGAYYDCAGNLIQIPQVPGDTQA